LQIYFDFEEKFIDAFKYKLKKDHIEINSNNSSQIPVVAGQYSKGDISKMIFRIEEITILDAMIAY